MLKPVKFLNYTCTFNDIKIFNIFQNFEYVQESKNIKSLLSYTSYINLNELYVCNSHSDDFSIHEKSVIFFSFLLKMQDFKNLVEISKESRCNFLKDFVKKFNLKYY